MSMRSTRDIVEARFVLRLAAKVMEASQRTKGAQESVVEIQRFLGVFDWFLGDDTPASQRFTRLLDSMATIAVSDLEATLSDRTDECSRQVLKVLADKEES